MKSASVLVSVWTWFAIFITVLVGNFLQAILFLLCYPFDRNRYVAGRTFRLIGVICAKLAPTWKFGVYGPFPKQLKPNTIVISNHASHADCFLISFLPWEMKWLGKASLFKIPLVGWCMALAGDIRVRRGVRSSAEQAMNRCKHYLRRGMPVFIFPEGTRSRDGVMQPFKDGAFRLAIEEEADILPLAVEGTQTALPKHSWRFGYSRALVTVGQPIPTKGMTLADVETLKGAARQQIEQMQAVLRNTQANPSRAQSDAINPPTLGRVDSRSAGA